MSKLLFLILLPIITFLCLVTSGTYADIILPRINFSENDNPYPDPNINVHEIWKYYKKANYKILVLKMEVPGPCLYKIKVYNDGNTVDEYLKENTVFGPNTLDIYTFNHYMISDEKVAKFIIKVNITLFNYKQLSLIESILNNKNYELVNKQGKEYNFEFTVVFKPYPDDNRLKTKNMTDPQIIVNGKKLHLEEEK